MRPQLSVWLVSMATGGRASWQSLFDQAQAADRAGIDRIALTGEHVVLGEHLEAYGRPELGGLPSSTHATGPDGQFLEPMVAMSMIAALTSRARITSGIMLAALRRPIVLAKAAATLDVLSGGRLDLGVGVGWQREEYGAAGLTFGDRGRLLDHSLEVCQALWRDRVATYSSAELAFERIHMMPKPVQAPGVPIWVAGNVTGPAMRRLARFGTGWIPWGGASQSPAALVEAIPQMRAAVAASGRDPAAVGVVGGIPVVPGRDGRAEIGPTMEPVPALVEAGVTDVRLKVSIPTDAAEAEDCLTRLVHAFADAVA